MKRFLLLLAFTLTLAIPAAAQDDPTALVIDAFARLEGGYRFTYGADTTQTYAYDDSAAETVMYRYDAAGEVDADGSYIGSTTLSGSGDNGADTMEIGFDFEVAQVDDVDYVSLGERRDAAPYFEDISSGWHLVADLEAEMGDSVYSALLRSVTQLNLPTAIPLESRLITSITEIEPSEIDGVPVRGFDIVIDGLQAYRDAVVESGTVSFENLLSVATLLEAGEFDYTLTVWIGADDGQLYRIEAAYFSLVPYVTAGIEVDDNTLPPFDQTQSGTFQFDITDHAAIPPITPPI